ncbi:MAG: cyclic nucleotide-binding domain-containing protein [Planctomycetota bacterium]|nr:cyclic nucleotide-binding domain-containing protein [Planctomycetota bacterium]
MTEPSVTDSLRGIQFLRDLPAELIDQLAGIAQVAEFPAGTVIFRQGDAASTLYFVVEGNVSLEICAPGVGCKRILTVGPGELLGWSPVLEHSRLTATARTISAVQAIALSGPQVLAICEQNPRLGYEFMKRAALALAKRLNATRLQLLDVFGTQMPAAADERPADAETH